MIYLTCSDSNLNLFILVIILANANFRFSCKVIDELSYFDYFACNRKFIGKSNLWELLFF